MTALSPIASLLAALTAQLQPAPAPTGGFLELLVEVETPTEEPAADGERKAEESEAAAAPWVALLPVVPVEPPPPPVTLEPALPVEEVVLEAPVVERPEPAARINAEIEAADFAAPQTTEVKEATEPPDWRELTEAPPIEAPRAKKIDATPAEPQPPQAEHVAEVGKPEIPAAAPPIPANETTAAPDRPAKPQVEAEAAAEPVVEPGAPPVDERPRLAPRLTDPPPERPAPAPVEPAAPIIREAAKARLAFAARLRPTLPQPKDVPAKPEMEIGVDPPVKPPEEPVKRETRRVAAPEAVIERPAEQHRTTWIQPPRNSEAPQAAERPSAVESKPAAARVAAPKREMPLPAPVARDIRLEVGSSEWKVEVRLVERGGEVHLAVRTPDNRLADGLREQLPELSARLEKMGFRADEWRAAEAGAPERRLHVETAGGGTTDARQQGQHQDGRQERREGEPRAPRGQDRETPRHKQKGNEFAWLMESLR